MNKIIYKAGVFSVLISVSAFGWAGACMPIAKACMQNGYYKGGEKMHKGLVKDCVLPVSMGNKTLPNVNFSEEQLKGCKVAITKKMKSGM